MNRNLKKKHCKFEVFHSTILFYANDTCRNPIHYKSKTSTTFSLSKRLTCHKHSH